MSLVTACALGVAHSPLMQPESTVMRQPSPAVFGVRFETSQGEFTIAVERAWAPVGADRFYNLARAGFFDGQRFFRVRAGFIAQFGLHGDSAVIAVWKHEAMPDDPVRTPNVRGTLAYAMTGPNTRTTQIYINLADNQRLDAEGFSPFGRVVSGMEVVDRLYAGYDESAGGGVRGGKQGRIEAGGNAYLMHEFPRLDYIVRARVVSVP
jgi:homoserine O-acetyltransferase